MRNFGNPSFGIFNTYHLPISNLPPEFRLESSSRLQLPPSQQNSRTTPENGHGGFPFIKTQWTNWPLQNQITMHESSTATGTQEIQFQGLLNQVSGPNTFYPNTGTSSHIQIPNMSIQPGMNPFGTGSSLPFHLEGLSASIQNRGNFVNSNQFEVGESSLRPPKIKMPWEDNNNIIPSPNLQLASWLYPPQDSLSQNNIFPTQNWGSLRNTVYDPLYEEMGLPVDPHLRIFVGRRDNGNTFSSTLLYFSLRHWKRT
ncbi:hypothetical protein TorRG33x02_348940 [Trema orientale]|uniref:Uncharacterized protein n=1 Tax=Trema orientale TaxID=63057 RepID=A0A2P5AJ85_TREOI|nr:hypothetical protein TorRG33x02_348940 [Trema orientale]